MFEFTWLWAFLLLPLPAAVYFFSKPKAQPSAIRLPKLPDGLGQKAKVSRWLVILMTTAWICLVGALSRPVWYGDPIEINLITGT